MAAAGGAVRLELSGERIDRVRRALGGQRARRLPGASCSLCWRSWALALNPLAKFLPSYRPPRLRNVGKGFDPV